jgi:hypothetical protein
MVFLYSKYILPLLQSFSPTENMLLPLVTLLGQALFVLNPFLFYLPWHETMRYYRLFFGSEDHVLLVYTP